MTHNILENYTTQGFVAKLKRKLIPFIIGCQGIKAIFTYGLHITVKLQHVSLEPLLYFTFYFTCNVLGGRTLHEDLPQGNVWSNHIFIMFSWSQCPFSSSTDITDEDLSDIFTDLKFPLTVDGLF